MILPYFTRKVYPASPPCNELSPMGSVNQYRCIQSLQHSNTTQSVGKGQLANPMHQQSDDTRMTLPSVVCLSVTVITDGESSLTTMRERYNINQQKQVSD
ncbi:hypothetical protein OUZ56_025985 [Daphnia magna]|uniref:Uncharacterized protein n=1 Tax=Daphnia magna TaxID=35525 RepID=A0ABQ9ZKH6_9CRUS|nr:hypothetical protein OUZ56_025985 [Daphnia magna]